MQTRREVNPNSFTLLRRDNHCENSWFPPVGEKKSCPGHWEINAIEAGTSHSEGAPRGRRPSPGRSAASRGEGSGGKGDMAALLPLGSAGAAKLERKQSLASSVIYSFHLSLFLSSLSLHLLNPSQRRSLFLLFAFYWITVQKYNPDDG